jgi:hypothetical protein
MQEQEQCRNTLSKMPEPLQHRHFHKRMQLVLDQAREKDITVNPNPTALSPKED